MGQITRVSSPGITVVSIDRETGPGAGAGQQGNYVIMLGEDAGMNSLTQRMVVLGYHAADAGITDTTNLLGTLAIGVDAVGSLVDAGSAGALVGGITALGDGAADALVHGSTTIVIGYQVLPNANPVDGNPLQANVIIGDRAFSSSLSVAGVRHGDCTRNVIVGYETAQLRVGAAFQRGMDRCVILGYQAAGSYDVNGSTNADGIVLIGYQAGMNIGATTANVDSIAIGRAAGDTMQGTGGICIGAASNILNSGNGAVAIGRSATVRTGGVSGVGQGAIAIGDSTQAAGTRSVVVGSSGGQASMGDYNTLLGGATVIHSTVTVGGTRNVLVGYGAGDSMNTGAGGALSERLVVETFEGGTRRALMFGQFDTGNVVFGNSVPGTDRDVDGAASRNILKLLNGVVGGLAPVGGGYFYVNAGALHWVGSAGTDTVVAPA